MSRFFKSAAFPILIVVVLAFFAQKLIGSHSNGPNYTYGNLIVQLQQHKVDKLALDPKSNSATVTLKDGEVLQRRLPGDAANQLSQDAITGRRPAPTRSRSTTPPRASGSRWPPTCCR